MLINTSVWLVQLDRTNYGLINPWNNSIYPSYTLNYAKITLSTSLSLNDFYTISPFPSSSWPISNSKLIRRVRDSFLLVLFLFNRGKKKESTIAR